MTVINLWQGAATSTGFRVNAKIDGSVAVLHIDGQMIGPITPTPEGVVKFEVSGLQPRTEYRYWIEVDGVADISHPGRLRTLPPAGTPQSFRFGTASCAGQNTYENYTQWPEDRSKISNVSNGPVFDVIRIFDPAFFVHTGDFHYKDIGTNEVSRFRDAFDQVLSAPRQAELYRNVPVAYMFDDHDFGINDANGDSPSAPAAKQAYRERVPHYPLSDDEGVWQSFVVGRVRFIITDLRSYSSNYRDPDSPDKTLLGDKQKKWFKDQMLASEGQLVCWFNTVPWHPATNQLTNWSNYKYERDELAAFFDEHGLGKRMFMVSGDWHGMGFDDGSNNPWGDFPIYHCAPLDAKPSSVKAPMTFSHGSNIDRQQWGLFTIEDTGEVLTVLAEGYVGNALTLSHSFSLGQSPVPQGEPVEGTTPVLAAHYGTETVKRWRTFYGGQVVDVVSAHVGTL